MALVSGVRWKPDKGRTSLETTMANFDPQAEGGPVGAIPMIAQLIAYDDTKIGATANPSTGRVAYKPGASAVEAEIVVLHEQVRWGELEAFATMTQAEIDVFWRTQLEDYRVWVTPAAVPLGMVKLSQIMAPPILLGA